MHFRIESLPYSFPYITAYALALGKIVKMTHLSLRRVSLGYRNMSAFMEITAKSAKLCYRKSKGLPSLKLL